MTTIVMRARHIVAFIRTLPVLVKKCVSLKLSKQGRVCQCFVFRKFPVQIQGHGQTMLPSRIFNQSLQANLALTPHVRPGPHLIHCAPVV